MRYLAMTAALFLSAASASSALGDVVFSNPITGTNPNSANPYTTGQTKDANVTVSGIGRGTGIGGQNANDRYNARDWESTTLDVNDYFEWTITPASGYEIDFTNFVYTATSQIAMMSTVGPTNFSFRASTDSFGSGIGTPTTTGTTISLSAAAFQNVTSAITFRLYGWGADADNRTFSVNDFTFNGTVAAVPEASAFFYGGLIVAGLCGWKWRQKRRVEQVLI
jgi:trimeric autotransporter adhesin